MTRPLPLAILALAAAFTATAADTIKLKSGEIVEGRIIEQNAAEIIVEVQFSPTIIDTRRIPRADIAVFNQLSMDEEAFQQIKEITPPATALDTTEHEKILNEKLRPYAKRFSYSPRAEDAKKMIAEFEAEIERLNNGDVKSEGVWYSAESFSHEKYQIEANKVFLKMKEYFAAGDPVETVNTFETLQRQYPQSGAFAEALSIALKAIDQLEQKLNFAVSNLPQTLSQRRQTIERTPPEQRAAIENAMKAEDARLAAIAADAQKNQKRFYVIVPFDEKGLRDMQTNLQNLRSQLSALDSGKIASHARLLRQAQKELEEGQIESAQASVTQLRAAWPEYEGLSRLEQRVQSGSKKPDDSAKVEQ